MRVFAVLGAIGLFIVWSLHIKNCPRFDDNWEMYE